MARTAKLTTGSITGHLIGQTAPAILAVGAMTSVGIVDAYFIGRLGSAELSAMSFVFPVAQTLASLGVGVMASIGSVVSRRLGAGEFERAHRVGNFGIVLAALLGLAMATALFSLRHALFGAMQAEADLLPLIDQYVVPFAMGFPLVLVMMGVNGNLRALGEAKRSSAIMIVFALANVVLDPLLIDGLGIIPGFGIAGAAYATILGYVLASVLGFRLLQHTELPLRFAVLGRARWAVNIRDLARVAVPASSANAINPFGLSILTSLLAAQGAAAVAGYGAATRLQAFALVPLLGLSGSIGAIVGQNWGADQPERSRLAMFEAGAFSALFGLVIAVFLANFGGWFAQFFTDDAEVAHHFARYLSIAAWGYAGFGVLIVANGAMNAVDKASVSLAQSFARVFFIMLPVAYLLKASWGAEAVYAAELAANLLGGVIAALLSWRILKSR